MQDEVKHVLFPLKQSKLASNVLTLGVGDDILAEQHMNIKSIELNHRTRFFGADPSEEAGRVYDGIGDYFPVGVAAKSGVLNSNVMLVQAHNPTYTWKKVFLHRSCPHRS